MMEILFSNIFFALVKHGVAGQFPSFVVIFPAFACPSRAGFPRLSRHLAPGQPWNFDPSRKGRSPFLIGKPSMELASYET